MVPAPANRRFDPEDWAAASRSLAGSAPPPARLALRAGAREDIPLPPASPRSQRDCFRVFSPLLEASRFLENTWQTGLDA